MNGYDLDGTLRGKKAVLIQSRVEVYPSLVSQKMEGDKKTYHAREGPSGMRIRGAEFLVGAATIHGAQLGVVGVGVGVFMLMLIGLVGVAVGVGVCVIVAHIPDCSCSWSWGGAAVPRTLAS